MQFQKISKNYGRGGPEKRNMKNIIIIPTYNEKESIKTLIPLIFELLPNIFIAVADDNSPDGTGSVVLEFKKEYPNLSLISRKQKDGLGKAYINAFREVLKDPDIKSIIMMDADFSPQLKYLPEMIEKSNDYSVVIGSRFVSGGKKIGVKLGRKILSSFGNLYCKIILRIPIQDYSCGFMVISAELLRKIDFLKISSSGYAFISELKYLLYKAGATFFEVPITFFERVDGQSKISWHIILEGITAPWKMIFKK
jgi:dolichol-phosphate mannosyltransferase